MGTGMVFVYLLIAALIAPIAWLMWWGVDSLGTRRPGLVPARAVTSDVVREAYPSAVDVNLPIRAGAVTIYNLRGREVATCAGPDAKGHCPHPAEDGTVPCAGCVLALPRPIAGSLEWQIPAGYRSCALGSYAVFRQ